MKCSINQAGINSSREHWVPWVVGMFAALVALGPALGPGSLLRLDLVALDELPVPGGVWGLGPELPRRVPLFVLLAWIAPLVGGAAAIKALLLVSLTAGFAGVAHLTRPAPLTARLGAGCLYALSPFTLTRVGVGHLFVVAVMGLLPWALPTLSQPHLHIRRTLLWGAALGLLGFFGGVVAILVAGAGLVCSRGTRAVAVVGALLVGQLPWLVPGVIVLAQGASFTGATGFPTDLDGWGGPLRVLAGHGFWASRYQVGASEGLWVPAIGATVLVAALAGRTRLPNSWGPPATGLGLGVLALVLASGWDVVAEPTATLIDSVAPAVRESQRLLVLFLVWAAPAAAWGAVRLAEAQPPGRRRELALVGPLILGLVLFLPGSWGIGGELDPVSLPDEWNEVAGIVGDEPGTVLALPWAQYVDLTAAGGERVLNPTPLWLGADVVASSRLGLEASTRERRDAREQQGADLAVALLAGEDTGKALARLGIRWVVLVHEIDREWEFYQVALEEGGDVEALVEGRTISLYRVPGWRGPIVEDTGHVIHDRPVLRPLRHLDAGGPATWKAPAAPGWLRGLSATGTTDAGLVRLPPGRGPLWYWPAILCVACYLLTLAAACWAWLSSRRLPPAPAAEPQVGHTTHTVQEDRCPED